MDDRLFTPAVVALVFLSFVMGTSEFIVMGILPDIASGLGVEYTAVGSLVSVFALSYAVFTPLITGVTGRFGRYRLAMSLAVVFILANLLSLVSWGYVPLLVSRVVTAAASGSLLAVGLTFVMDLVTQRHRSAAVSWVFAGFSLSSIVGVPLGTYMSGILGWRSVFVLILLMSLVALAFAARTLPRSGGASGPRRKGAARRMLRDPRVLLACLVTVFSAGGVYAVYTYITPIFEDELGFSEGMVSLGLMAYGVAVLASNLMSGRIASHGGFRTVRWGCLLEGAALFLLPTALAGAVTGMADILLIGLMMYVMNASVQVHLLEIGTRDYPEAINLVSSLNPTSFNVGIAAGSYLAGIVFDSFGLPYIGYLGAAFLLMAAVCSCLVILACRGEGRGTSSTARDRRMVYRASSFVAYPREVMGRNIGDVALRGILLERGFRGPEPPRVSSDLDGDVLLESQVSRDLDGFEDGAGDGAGGVPDVLAGPLVDGGLAHREPDLLPRDEGGDGGLLDHGAVALDLDGHGHVIVGFGADDGGHVADTGVYGNLAFRHAILIDWV